MLTLINRNATVLDFGCSDGTLARELQVLGCRVTGIEVNREAALQAAAVCDDVLVADLDVVPLSRMLQGRTFDIAVFADVLEHLRDPWRILGETRGLLAPDGYVVASIPNVAHWAVRLRLLSGRFDYVPLGILDDTHLRFFTRATLERLFSDTGYAIETVERTTLAIGEANEDLVSGVDLGAFPPNVIARLAEDEDAATVQFVVRARRVPSIVTELKRYDTAAELVANMAVLHSDDVRNAALTADLAAEREARAAAEAALVKAREDVRSLADLTALIEHWEDQAHQAKRQVDAANAEVTRLRRELGPAQAAQRATSEEHQAVVDRLTFELSAWRAHAAQLERAVEEAARAQIELALRLDAESRRLNAESDALELAIAAMTNGPVGRMRRWLRGSRGTATTQE